MDNGGLSPDADRFFTNQRNDYIEKENRQLREIIAVQKAKIDAVINKIMAKVNNAETQIELIKMLEELKNENFI